MSKRTDEAKRLASLPPKPASVKRSFTPEETMELQEMQRMVNGHKFVAAQVKGNTALVPRGKDVAEELEATARLLDNAKNGWVAQKLLECGYPEGTKCSINLSTGEIIVNDNEPPNSTEAPANAGSEGADSVPAK